MFICLLYLNYPTHICRCKTFFLPLAVIRRHKRCVASRQKKDVSPSRVSTPKPSGDTYSMSPNLLSSDKYMLPLIFSDDVYMSSLFQVPTHICRCKAFVSPTRSYKATQRDVSPHGKKRMCRLLACRRLCY